MVQLFHNFFKETGVDIADRDFHIHITWMILDQCTLAVCLLLESPATSRDTQGTRSCVKTPTTERGNGGRSYGHSSRWWGSPRCHNNNDMRIHFLRWRFWWCSTQKNKTSPEGHPLTLHGCNQMSPPPSVDSFAFPAWRKEEKGKVDQIRATFKVVQHKASGDCLEANPKLCHG